MSATAICKKNRRKRYAACDDVVTRTRINGLRPLRLLRKRILSSRLFSVLRRKKDAHRVRSSSLCMDEQRPALLGEPLFMVTRTRIELVLPP